MLRKRERRLRGATVGFPEKDVKGRCFTAADSEIASALGTCLPVRTFWMLQMAF